MRLCGLSRTFYLLEGDPDFDTSINGESVGAEGNQSSIGRGGHEA